MSGNGILFGMSVPGEMRYSYDSDGLRTRKSIRIDASDSNLGDGSFLNWFFTDREGYLDVTYKYIWDGKTFLGYDITMNGTLLGLEIGHIVMRVVYSDAGESLGYMYAMIDTAGEVVLGDMVWYVKNILGDIQGLYSETYQSMEAAYTYDAWGTPTIQSLIEPGTGMDFSGLRILAYMLVNQLAYCGYFYDAETG